MKDALEGAEVLVQASAPSPRCLVIVGGVHGNEPAGIRAINMVRNLVRAGEWQIDGNVFGLIGNPRAVETGVRFIEENLNRAFGRAENPNSYEARRAIEISTYLEELSKQYPEIYLLDLHSVSIGDVQMLIFSAENPLAKKWVQSSDTIPLHISWTERVAPGTLIGAVGKIGGTGIAIECGNHSSETGTTVALEHVENALVNLGMLKDHSVTFKNKVAYEGTPRTYTLTSAIKPHAEFVWDLPIASELFVAKDTQYAHDESGSHIAPEDSYIIMPSKVPHPEDFDAGFLAVKSL